MKMGPASQRVTSQCEIHDVFDRNKRDSSGADAVHNHGQRCPNSRKEPPTSQLVPTISISISRRAYITCTSSERPTMHVTTRVKHRTSSCSGETTTVVGKHCPMIVLIRPRRSLLLSLEGMKSLFFPRKGRRSCPPNPPSTPQMGDDRDKITTFIVSPNSPSAFLYA